LADVAALAGVSLKTASRALNAEYGVAPATAERGVVAGLGHVVDAVARYTEAGATRINVTLAEPPEHTWPLLAEALL